MPVLVVAVRLCAVACAFGGELEEVCIVNGQLRHKIALDAFWNEFGGKKTDGTRFDVARKIESLKRMADTVITYGHQRPLEERRAEFEELKHVLHKAYTRRNCICFCCGNPTEARHHIIQLQNGGLNTRKNVVSLCNKCHAEIHPWL